MTRDERANLAFRWFIIGVVSGMTMFAVCALSLGRLAERAAVHATSSPSKPSSTEPQP